MLLVLFRASPKQNDECLAVFAEIDSIARAEIDFAFKDTASDSFYSRPIGDTQLKEGRRDLGCRRCIKSIEPGREGRPAPRIEIFQYLNRDRHYR